MPDQHPSGPGSDSQRDSETVFRGVKFDVQRRSVPTGGGETAVREVVVHPGAVVVLPILHDGRIVMIRNYRFAVEETLWELCAGTLEEGESPEETAARELVEETGYRADRLEPLTTFYTTPGICTERMHAFVARGLTEVGQALEEGERIEVELVEPGRALEMAMSGEIKDAKTLATLLLHHAS